jgi:hypothetical protein
MCDFYSFGQDCHDDCSLKLPAAVVSAPISEQPVIAREPMVENIPVEEPVIAEPSVEIPVIAEVPVFVAPKVEEPIFIHEEPKLESVSSIYL